MSDCHGMMGHIVGWYDNGIAGIQPLKPGFGEIRIRPYLPEGMTEFTCTYRSVSGTIKVAVKESAEKIFLEAEVPAAIKSEIDADKLEQRGKGVQIIEKISPGRED